MNRQWSDSQTDHAARIPAASSVTRLPGSRSGPDIRTQERLIGAESLNLRRSQEPALFEPVDNADAVFPEAVHGGQGGCCLSQ